MEPVHYLIWDDYNLDHIKKHAVILREVEEVCRGRYIARPSYGGRFILIGPTMEGRILAVAIAPKGTSKYSYYPITARPASRKERKLYLSETGGGDNL